MTDRFNVPIFGPNHAVMNNDDPIYVRIRCMILRWPIVSYIRTGNYHLEDMPQSTRKHHPRNSRLGTPRFPIKYPGVPGAFPPAWQTTHQTTAGIVNRSRFLPMVIYILVLDNQLSLMNSLFV